MDSFRVVVAAHHEAAHAVVAVDLGLPLLDEGIHIDTDGGGVCQNCHRVAGDRSQSPSDTAERSRSIVTIKAGYLASCRVSPGYPRLTSADDRQEEIDLLNEMYTTAGPEWLEADASLSRQAEDLVNRRWNVIEKLAETLLSKRLTKRPHESYQYWMSGDSLERFMAGEEIATCLQPFGLRARVRSRSDGTYYDPDLYDNDPPQNL